MAPEWVASHRGDIELLDVRSPEELRGDLGVLSGARSIPLDELRARTGEVKDDKPVIVVCQTGKRSGMATVILKKAGLTRVANLAGGMVKWRELGLPG